MMSRASSRNASSVVGDVADAVEALDLGIKSTRSGKCTIIDDEGFVHISSHRELNRSANVDATTLQENARARKEFEQNLRRRLKAGRVPLSNITPSAVSACTLDVGDLVEIVTDIDAAIKRTHHTMVKPIQRWTVAEYENKIKAANQALAQLKQRPKGVQAPTPEEIELATKEHEVLTQYLEEQMALAAAFSEAKAHLAALDTIKKACLDVARSKDTESQPKESSPAGSRMEAILDHVNALGQKPLNIQDLASSQITLPGVKSRMQHPYPYLNRFKHAYGVFIQAERGKPGTFNVYGARPNVDKCVGVLASLNKAVEIKIHISTFRKLVPNVEEFQESNGVFVAYVNGVLDILGPADKVDAVAANIRNSLAKVSEDKAKERPVDAVVRFDLDYAVGRALVYRFKNMLRPIEDGNNVNINIVVPSRGDATSQAQVRVEITPRARSSVAVSIESQQPTKKEGLSNGDKSSSCEELESGSEATAATTTTARAKAQLVALAKTFATKPINIDGDACDYILSSDCSKRFGPLNACLIKNGKNGALLVAPREHLNFSEERVQRLLGTRKTVPRRMVVAKEKLGAISLQQLEAIQDWTGAVIEVCDSGRDTLLLIYGDEAQQNESERQVGDMLRSHVTVKRRLAPAHYSILNIGRHRVLDLERNHSVTITRGREYELEIGGVKDRVDECVASIQAIGDELVNLDERSLDGTDDNANIYASLTLKPGQAGLLIGKGGSTKRQVIDECALDELLVVKTQGADVVIMYGDRRSIEMACGQIASLLPAGSTRTKTHGSIGDDAYNSRHSFLRRNFNKSYSKRDNANASGQHQHHHQHQHQHQQQQQQQQQQQDGGEFKLEMDSFPSL